MRAVNNSALQTDRNQPRLRHISAGFSPFSPNAHGAPPPLPLKKGEGGQQKIHQWDSAQRHLPNNGATKGTTAGPQWRRPKKDSSTRQGKPGGPAPGGEAASVFEQTSVTVNASHECYRGSLRSSSKRVPNNPSSNGVNVCFFRDGGHGPGVIRPPACPIVGFRERGG